MVIEKRHTPIMDYDKMDYDKEVLADLNLHGAEHYPELVYHEVPSVITSMLENKYLRTLETPLGLVAVLGPKGRKLFDRDPAYVPEPDEAAADVLTRRVRKKLESQGWRFTEYSKTRLHVLNMRNEVELLSVYVRWYDPKLNTVKNLLEDLRRLHGDRKVLVAARKLQPYDALLKDYPQLNLLELQLVLPPEAE